MYCCQFLLLPSNLYVLTYDHFQVTKLRNIIIITESIMSWGQKLWETSYTYHILYVPSTYVSQQQVIKSPA